MRIILFTNLLKLKLLSVIISHHETKEHFYRKTQL